MRISALTAWQGLFDRAAIQPGERILVQGAAGAVGLFVVQFAHRHGANVIATNSSENISLVQALGADQVIDYKASAGAGIRRGGRPGSGNVLVGDRALSVQRCFAVMPSAGVSQQSRAGQDATERTSISFEYRPEQHILASSLHHQSSREEARHRSSGEHDQRSGGKHGQRTRCGMTDQLCAMPAERNDILTQLEHIFSNASDRLTATNLAWSELSAHEYPTFRRRHNRYSKHDIYFRQQR